MHIHILTVDVLLHDDVKTLLGSQPDIVVVGHAVTGREALSIVVANPVDIVIMDIAMPEIDGLLVARRLAQQHPDVKVIVLSMQVTAEHIYQALQAGAVGYILKESAGEELIQAIRRVAAGYTYFSQPVSAELADDYLRLRTRSVDKSRLESLSQREYEVLQLVVEGLPSSEIAERLSLAKSTIDTYRSRIMRKLKTDSLPELVRFAIQNGLTPP